MIENNDSIKVLKQLVDFETAHSKDVIIPVSISKSGLPCLYESGGAFTNTAEAQIISDSTGKPKTPLYIYTRGDLCNKNHAVIPVQVGDMVFKAHAEHGIVSVVVYKITDIDLSSSQATLSVSPWDDNMLPFLAITHKCTTYHCRQACYIKHKPNTNTNNEEA